MASPLAKKSTGKQLHDLFREVFVLHAALSKIMNDVHEQTGLTTAQHKIIRTLNDCGPATVPDMAATLEVSRQFVQTVCNGLLSRGLIEFRDNPRHKRSKRVALTEQGLETFKAAREEENKIIEKTLPEVDPEKVADAYELLIRLRKKIGNL